MIDFTTAPDEEVKRAYDAIARELGDDRFFTTKELDVLPKILAPFEQVLSFSSGLMDGNTWLIVLTDQRVLFLDKGMLFGLKQTSIELENIVSIDGETGLVFGTLRMSTAAGPHEIRNVWKRTVNAFVNKVRAAASARKRGERMISPGTEVDTQSAPLPNSVPTPAPAPAPTPQSTREITPSISSEQSLEIARLDRLRNAGSITDEEYHRQRSRIG